MIKVTVDITSVRDGEKPSAQYLREAEKGSIWNREELADVTAGMPNTRREFLLDDNERLIIQQTRTEQAVYDPEQMAAVPASTRPDLAPNTAKVDPAMPERTVETRAAPMPQPTPPGAQPKTPGEQGNAEQLSRDRTQPLGLQPKKDQAQTASQLKQPGPGATQSAAGPTTSSTTPKQGAASSAEVKKDQDK